MKEADNLSGSELTKKVKALHPNISSTFSNSKDEVS